MPVPVAPTVAVLGQPARAGSQFNALAAQVAFLLDPPVVYAYQTAANNCPDSTVTLITMDAELVDTDNVHSTSTNTSRLTIVTAGRYRVLGQLSYNVSGAVGYRDARLLKNGANVALTRIPAPNAISYTQVYDEILCAVGDYIELAGFQNSGAAVATGTGVNTTFLKARWCGVS